MIIEQEEKFNLIFDKIEKKQTEQNMFNMFIDTYPEDWKRLKITFSKFNRSKQFGRTIPLQRPEQSLRTAIRIWLKKQ